jgi:hypothetical protein
MPPSYKIFLTTLRGDHILTLQKLVTYLIQEESMMKLTEKQEPAMLLNIQFKKRNFNNCYNNAPSNQYNASSSQNYNQHNNQVDNGPNNQSTCTSR